MNEIKPNNRNLVASMAANIAGPVLAAILNEGTQTSGGVPSDVLETVAQTAVGQALEILDAIKMRTSCGRCQECNHPSQGKRCSKIPGDES